MISPASTPRAVSKVKNAITQGAAAVAVAASGGLAYKTCIAMLFLIT